ncbi:MAG TPA: Glu-tRNA(Gln) amidotransferase subunit GatD [Candidatus Nanoarchaeia archaeon]|nr:Glu-tRNA(Gln) amidotransferase subunit GatD [Candidatus Nanoarchaeia archaeon]
MKKQVKASPGDYISIMTTKESTEGTLLESHEPDIFLIKLKSGYNIGIKKEDIYDVRVIRKAKPEEKTEKENSIELKSKKELPGIAMIMTGGTISSRLDPSTGGVKWLTSPADLFKFYPELFDIANIKRLEIPFMMASENMSSKEWKKIAKLAAELLNDAEIKGIIITHGTDTLHYTASAFSFFLKNLNKPVVLTYSQRSTDRASSDASLNLQCAARAAISDIAEVMIVGHASTNDDFCYAMPATKVRKMHTSRRDAFKVINSMPIAKIFPGKIEILSQHKNRNNNKVKLDAAYEDKVALVKFYPGMSPDIIDCYAKNCRGLVIEATGLGHLATKEARYNLIPKLKQAIKKGLIVCAAPQTLYGRLNPLVYSPGRELQKLGIIFLEDMLPETALVKLGWVLAHKEWAKNKEKIKEKMLENISHELNPRLGKEFIK